MASQYGAVTYSPLPTSEAAPRARSGSRVLRLLPVIAVACAALRFAAPGATRQSAAADMHAQAALTRDPIDPLEAPELRPGATLGALTTANETWITIDVNGTNETVLSPTMKPTTDVGRVGEPAPTTAHLNCTDYDYDKDGCEGESLCSYSSATDKCTSIDSEGDDDTTKNEVDDKTYGDIALTMYREGYAPRDFSWYPWEHIVEPNVVTRIRPQNAKYLCSQPFEVATNHDDDGDPTSHYDNSTNNTQTNVDKKRYHEWEENHKPSPAPSPVPTYAPSPMPSTPPAPTAAARRSSGRGSNSRGGDDDDSASSGHRSSKPGRRALLKHVDDGDDHPSTDPNGGTDDEHDTTRTNDDTTTTYQNYNNTGVVGDDDGSNDECVYTFDWKIEALCSPSSAQLTAHDSIDDDDVVESKTDDPYYCGDMVGKSPDWEQGINGFMFANSTGPEIALIFKEAATQYSLSVTVYETIKTVSVNHVKGVTTTTVRKEVVAQSVGIPIMCKYVRREIRSLTRDDRERVLDALAIVHKMPLLEGRAKYGGKFFDATGATRKHLARMTIDRCTPWHNAKVFFNAHAAFTIEMEQSLQSIDASIAMPYWDYTIDSHFLGLDWPDSEIWSDEWFGPSTSPTDDRVLITSRFAYSPIRTNGMAVERNGYGRIMDRMNADDAEYLTRGARNVCGIKTHVGLPGCTSLHKAIQSIDLEELDRNVEYDFHGYIHMLLGGAWDCRTSLDYRDLQNDIRAAGYPTVAEAIPGYVEDVALDLNVLWRYWMFSGYLKMPDGCSNTTDFEDCRGRCPLIDTELDHLSDSQIYTYLDDGQILTALDGLMLSYNDAMDRYLVTGLDWGNSITVYKWLLPILCGPGKMSPQATPLAATYDPIFWPSHNNYERLWAWKRLHPDSAFSNLWKDDSSTCYGHNLHDSLPWRNFLRSENRRKDYTNQELLDLFDPRNPELPHVYDSFEWPHCHWNTVEHPTHKPTMAPSVNMTYAPTGPTHHPTVKHTPKPSSGIYKGQNPSGHKERVAHDHFPGVPTPVPTNPTGLPTPTPTPLPSYTPTPHPSSVPTKNPTDAPSPIPSYAPSLFPTPLPSYAPSWNPTAFPTYEPTSSPSAVQVMPADSNDVVDDPNEISPATTPVIAP